MTREITWFTGRVPRAAMERQKELMALRATVPAVAPVSATPLAGKLRRHELGYKNVLDTLFAAPGTVSIGSRTLTVRLMPAVSEAERVALRAFLADVAVRRLSLPGDPDRRRLAWALR